MLFSILFFLGFSVFGSLGAPYPVPNPTNGTCYYDGLTMADPEDPRAYYVCCQHLWLLKYCPSGELFNRYQLICQPSNNYPPTVAPQICIPGDKIKNPFDLSKFDECIDGTHWVTKSCPSGANFDEYTKQCQILPTTVACSLGDTKESGNGNSSQYLYCNGHGWEIRQCSPNSSYDKNLKKCVENSYCDAGFKPNPEDCRTYFQCVHNQWMKRDCGPGTKWVQQILGCDYYNGSC